MGGTLRKEEYAGKPGFKASMGDWEHPGEERTVVVKADTGQNSETGIRKLSEKEQKGLSL